MLGTPRQADPDRELIDGTMTTSVLAHTSVRWSALNDEVRRETRSPLDAALCWWWAHQRRAGAWSSHCPGCGCLSTGRDSDDGRAAPDEDPGRGGSCRLGSKPSIAGPADRPGMG